MRSVAKVALTTPCLLSERTPSQRYPQVSIDGKVLNEGRVVLVAKLRRPISDGMVARHLCYEKRCIEPEHLVESSNSENGLDADVARTGTAELFPCGHERRDDNTKWQKDAKCRSGQRRTCRTCHTASCRVWNAANRDR